MSSHSDGSGAAQRATALLVLCLCCASCSCGGCEKHIYQVFFVCCCAPGHSLPGAVGGSVTEVLAGLLLVSGLVTEVVKFAQGMQVSTDYCTTIWYAMYYCTYSMFYCVEQMICCTEC
jgi:uncharacterized membrane protein YphA (DoxX/SURF4 family)